MPDDFDSAIEALILKAPSAWLETLCAVLRSFPTTATADFIAQRLPETNNANLPALVDEVIRHAGPLMSWEALSWLLQKTASLSRRWQEMRRIELLWTGPSPASAIPARRIDQSLYDLIARSKKEILLVTFAAARIERLTTAILAAAKRSVTIRLVLEFQQTSEGGLSYDALKAFPSELRQVAKVYCWPIEHRQRNDAGRPGKLHTKLAVIDEVAIVSSANLTDDAFNRNMEIGARIQSPEFVANAVEYIDKLIGSGVLVLV